MGNAEPLYYNPYEIPPGHRFQTHLHIPRPAISDFLRELHVLILAKKGGCWYYPGEQSTRCRFEWHGRWKRREFALRIGLFLHVLPSAPLTCIEGYVADARAYGSRAYSREPVSPPSIGIARLKAILAQVEGLIGQAQQRMQPSSWSEHAALFYLKTPPGYAVREPLDLWSGRVFALPSRVFRHECLTPIGCIGLGSCPEVAIGKSIEQLRRCLALLSLGSSATYDVASPNWPRGFRPPQTVGIDDDVSALFPSQTPVPGPDYFIDGAGERLQWTFGAWSGSPTEAREALENALFAFDAFGRHQGAEGTIASVALIAALGSLSRSRRVSCQGTVSCSECGTSPGGHAKVSEYKAIASLIQDMLQLDDSTQQRVGKLLRRVYSKQRSSYVHAAELRHHERGREQFFPLGMPTSDRLQGEALDYEADLMSLGRITRFVLLRFLAASAGAGAGEMPFDLDVDTLFARPRFHSSIRLVGTRWICVIPSTEDA